MMNAMRSLAKSWFAKLLLGLLIVSFGVWGIEDMVRRVGSHGAPATVGGKEISRLAFERAYQQEAERAQAALGKQYSPELLHMLGLERQVIERLVAQEMLAREVHSLGLRVSDAEVAKSIRANPMFKGKDGAFDKALFEETLRRNGLTEALYAEDVRRGMALDLLMQGLGAGAPVNATMLDVLRKAGAEERAAEIVLLNSAMVKDMPAPDDAALEAFYKANMERFSAPETRSGAYVTVKAEALGGSAPPEAELKKMYEEKAAFFGGKAAPYATVRPDLVKEWKATHAEGGAQAFAAKLEDALAGGQSLKEAAKEFNLTYAELGSLPQDAKGVDALVLKALFSTQEGSESPLQKNAGGDYFMLHTESVTPAQPHPMAEVRGQVVEGWRTQETARRLKAMADGLATEMNKDARAAVASHGLKTANVSGIKRGGVKLSNGVALPSPLLDELFTLKPGQATKAYPVGGQYVIAIAGARAARTPAPLTEAQAKAEREKLATEVQEELLDGYLRYLREKYDVRINEEALAAFSRAPDQ